MQATAVTSHTVCVLPSKEQLRKSRKGHLATCRGRLDQNQIERKNVRSTFASKSNEEERKKRTRKKRMKQSNKERNELKFHRKCLKEGSNHNRMYRLSSIFAPLYLSFFL